MTPESTRTTEDFDRVTLPYLTLIIPVYNEQHRIADTLYTIKEYLAAQPYLSEILIVDDGSQDLTADVVHVVDFHAKELCNQPTCRILKNDVNEGKGYSIARGMEMARGKFIVFVDADLPSPITEIPKFLDLLEQGFDAVVGSRYLQDSRLSGRSFTRSLASQSFKLLVSAMRLDSVSDTQCGFKAFNAESARRIVLEQHSFGFCFDVEQLYIAKNLGMKIGEVPVEWQDKPGSSVSLIRDSIRMLKDLCTVRRYH